MSLIPYYLQFVSEICEGKRPLPEGFALHETDDLKKDVELQTQIQTVGIPEFVRRCAAQTGESIPQADYDAFDPNDLNAAIAQLAAERLKSAAAPSDRYSSGLCSQRRLNRMVRQHRLVQLRLIAGKHDAAGQLHHRS